MAEKSVPIVSRATGEEVVSSGGKINLFLFVAGRLPNGYHELHTLFVPLPAPADTLVFRPAERATGITVHCLESDIDLEHNTLTRAYTLYAEATGFAPAVDIDLVKGIPRGAGLGGGSADGAEVLAWLQRHAPEPLGEPELNAVAARVGADVPFFLLRRPCMAGGIGEKLVPVDPGLGGWSCVLVCPHIHVNTAWAYAAWDAEKASFFLTEKTKADKNNRSSCQSFYGMNDFEPVVFAAYPELAVWKKQLLQGGAEIAGMSGSGSALFGLFRSPCLAAQAACTLRREKEVLDVFGPFVF